MRDSFNFTPVVIIGAGRSGTNALRNALVALPGFVTWECDEINPIWRHGNASWPDDELPAEYATPKLITYIRNRFRVISRQQGHAKFVVEKTCANSLRVPFVAKVLPEAKYIHIQRDGVDVVASAQKRWSDEFELPRFSYLISKARYTPLVDLPRYAWTYLRSRLGRILFKKSSLSVWGPRFQGMDIYEGVPTLEMCAHQWSRCVINATESLESIPAENVLTIRYEAFVEDPINMLRIIHQFLGVSFPHEELEKATMSISQSSVGKGYNQSSPLPETVRDILAPGLSILKDLDIKH